MTTNTKFKSKKVLLIGGAGFIGHNLALKLADEGHNVTIADSFSVNNLTNLSVSYDTVTDANVYAQFIKERINLLKNASIKFELLDARNKYDISSLLDADYEVVYLLAAVSHASRSNRDVKFAIENSYYPFLNVLTALQNKPNTRLVYLSSSTVYGDFTKDIVDEDDECKPFGMYAVMKRNAELLLIETSKHTELNMSIVRPSALYGERCISRRVSQIFLENAFAGRPLIFKGSKDEKLDFTYIQDLIQGLILAGFHDKATGQIFNITFGDAQKVLSLYEILTDYFDPIELSIENRDQATPKRGTLSNEKARTLIGFSPEFPLEIGYRRYIEWYINKSKTEQLMFNKIRQHNE